MQSLSADSKWRGPIPKTSGERILMYADVLDEFAQNLAESIILSSLEQMEKLEPEVLQPIQTPEILAEELALAIVEVALKDVCLPQYPPPDVEKNDCEEAENGPPVDASGEEEDLLELEMISLRELQTHRNSQSNHPPLYQSGLPAVGSLDYPDAPPTTPLIPELERSRNSFARKLKGGLANVFLPSPPPPTPKDKEDNSGGEISDAQVELMEHLMHSLSTNDLVRDGLQAHGAGVEAFAEVLSSDVLSWVLNVKNKQQGSDESDLHQLAYQLAETIITSSLDKTKCDLLSD
ncbi:A-kinase anchor protein 11 isoform X2 [Gambusia affinis]|nr:A-kinase anchor protein 11 isoform X2 [Gambusia affinis]